MDQPSYKSQYLERLSTDELIGLAEGYGLEIPPGLERVFIIEEILYLDRRNIDKTESIDEIVELPKTQSTSMIDVIVRDPLWAFVFWEIKGHDQDRYENHEEFEGYCLRVIPLKEEDLRPDLPASFIVTVGAKDSAWYLGIPPEHGSLFKVELCVSQWENIVVLAASRPFKMPRLIEPKHKSGKEQAVYNNPLALLSGVEHFPLLRSMVRMPRPRSE